MAMQSSYETAMLTTIISTVQCCFDREPTRAFNYDYYEISSTVYKIGMKLEICMSCIGIPSKKKIATDSCDIFQTKMHILHQL